VNLTVLTFAELSPSRIGGWWGSYRYLRWPYSKMRKSGFRLPHIPNRSRRVTRVFEVFHRLAKPCEQDTLFDLWPTPSLMAEATTLWMRTWLAAGNKLEFSIGGQKLVE